MNRLFSFVLSVSTIWLAVKYSFDVNHVIISLTTILLIFTYFHSVVNLRGKIFTLFLIIYIYCSVHIVALLELSSVGFYKDTILFSEYNNLAKWGNSIFFVLFASLNILNIIQKKKIVNINEFNNTSNTVIKSNQLFKYASFLVFFLQILSIVLGLAGDHFDAGIVLPFHLNGIIDEYRSGIYPFIFAIYIYDRLIKNENISKNAIIYITTYALLEMFVRNSKGAFVFSFLPFIVMLAFIPSVSFKKISKYAVPLIFALAFLYPIVENARQEGQITIESLITASKIKKNGEEASSPYIRTFMTGVYYIKVLDYVDADLVSFDFKNLPFVILMRGGSVFMTRTIDGVPEGYHYSSGITGLCDAILWGGHGMCLLLIIIFTIFAHICDNNKFLILRPPYRLILFFLLYNLITGRSFSFFIDVLFVPSIVSIFLKIFITKYYYKKLF